MLIQAATGAKVPLEHDTRMTIAGATCLEVVDSAYYRRLILDGSLVAVAPSDPVPTSGDEPEL